MFPADFDYCAPRTLDEAVSILAERGEEAKILAGGQSLVPLLKLRFVRPELVVDINRLPNLDAIREDSDSVTIGSLVRHQQMANDPIIRQYFPWVTEVVHHIGDRQIRSLGTVAGTLAEADPSGDWSAIFLALDAELVVVGVAGERVVACRDWYQYAFTPAIGPDEVIREIRVAKPKTSEHGKYVKLERRAGDYPIAACAVVATHNKKRICQSVRVALVGVGQVPVLAGGVAEMLLDETWTAELLQLARRQISESIDPLSDNRGSSDYKRVIAGVAFERAAFGVLGDPAGYAVNRFVK